MTVSTQIFHTLHSIAQSFFMSNYELHQQTQQNLSRVNEQLDALVDITGQQRVLARSIGSELEDQKHMLSEVDQHMDKTGDEIEKATSLLDEVKKSSGTCAAWILMILLLISIVIVWVVPRKN